MSLRDLAVLSGLSLTHVRDVVCDLGDDDARKVGRPRRLERIRRVLLVLVWLRTNLTERGLGAVFGVSQITAHRTIKALLPKIAALHPSLIPQTKEHLLLDGTSIPVHDQARTKKSKNYRRSINTQIVATRKRKIVFVSPAWTGNRNDIVVAREEVP